MARTELLIDGRWVQGGGDEPITVHSPGSGEHLADVSAASVADVDATVVPPGRPRSCSRPCRPSSGPPSSTPPPTSSTIGPRTSPAS